MKILNLPERGERWGREVLHKQIGFWWRTTKKFWDQKWLILPGPGYQWYRKCCIKFAQCKKVSAPQHQKKVDDFTSFMVQKRVLLARWFLFLFIVVWPSACNRHFDLFSEFLKSLLPCMKRSAACHESLCSGSTGYPSYTSETRARSWSKLQLVCSCPDSFLTYPHPSDVGMAHLYWYDSYWSYWSSS